MGGSISSTQKKSAYYAGFAVSLPEMSGKVVAITGCTSGTGFVAAKTMLQKGAHVVMLNRRSERSASAFLNLTQEFPTAKVTSIDCDLMDFASIRKAASELKSKFPNGIDVLCNNAGIMADEDKATKDGYDVQMQTNHLSHFLLTKEVFPLLENAAARTGEARIVNHSSVARAFPNDPFDAKYLGPNGGNLGGNGNSMLFGGARWKRYHQSKLANVIFTLALDQKLRARGSKVKVLCAAPGLAATNLQTTAHKTDGMGGGLATRLTLWLAQSAEDGTMPLLHCIASPGVASGSLYEPTRWSGMWGLPGLKPLEPVCTRVADQGVLWAESERAVGEFKL